MTTHKTDTQVVIAALLHYGAACGAAHQSDVTTHADGWQCVDILRSLGARDAADVLASKLVSRSVSCIDT